jgi:hypothetical protein
MPRILECCDNDQVTDDGGYLEVYHGNVEYVISVISSERKLSREDAIAALLAADADNPLKLSRCLVWTERSPLGEPVDPTTIISNAARKHKAE